MTQRIKYLSDVCRLLDSGTDSWRGLANAHAEKAASGIRDEIGALLGRVPATDRVFKRSKLQPALSLLELAAVQFTDLGLIAYERANASEPLLWPRKPVKKGTFILQILGVSLANTLLSVRQLVLAGFDQQARVLARYFVELADLTVAVAFDYEFFVKYATGATEFAEAYPYWRKHLAPNKVRSVLDRFDDSLQATDEIKKVMQDVRSDTYRWLSAYSHAHVLGQAFAALSRYQDKEDRIIPKFGGTLDGASIVTLRKTVIYAWMTSLQLGVLLATPDHGWYGLTRKKDRQRSWFFYRREVFTRLFLRHYSTLANSSDNHID